MYPLGTTTFSHHKKRFPTISHQFLEVVGKQIKFPTESFSEFSHQIIPPSIM